MKLLNEQTEREIQLKKNSFDGQVFDLTEPQARILRAENATRKIKKGNQWEAVIQVERHQENKHNLPGTFIDHLVL